MTTVKLKALRANRQKLASLTAAALLWAVPAVAADLIVSAAASLTNAFTEIAGHYEKTHPERKVYLNFGGSGQLLQQIARGAPVGVFAPADQETMDRAQMQNLIVSATRRNFIRNRLVLIASADAKFVPMRLEDLRHASVRRIAISNADSVPAGRYSRQALEEAGLWSALKDKFINTQHVRQSLDYVARGEVDVGFVYATDAAVMSEKVKILFEVPTATPVYYPIAAVRGNDNEAAAGEFIDFVRSPAGRRILVRHGFLEP